MEVVKFEVKGRKGIEISCFKIIPDGEIKGVVHILHGMGEYKDRYIHFAKYLAKNSFAVYTQDYRKHGYSVCDPSQVGIFTKEDTWDNIIDDCNFVNNKIRKDLPNAKVISLGHSMGSTVVCNLISKYPDSTDIAILSGSLSPITMGRALVPLLLSTVMSIFNPKNNRSPFFGKLFNDPLLKAFKQRRTKFDWLCTDEELVDKYIEDPLCGYNYSTRFYKEFIKGMLNVNKSDVLSATKKIQILFISGKEDSVGDFGEGVKATKELFSGHGFSDLTLEIVENARHEILNEKNKETTYKFILDWIEKSLEKIEAK